MKYILSLLFICSSLQSSVAQQTVDLGLSVLWADRNVGADNPEEPGIYVAWAELSPKSEYLMTNYRYCLGEFRSPTKYYAFDPAEIITEADGKSVLEEEDDVATTMLANGWRMPLHAEIMELVDSCKWEWIDSDKTPGYRVTGPNGNSIFLPAAGIRTGDRLMYDRHEGYYWTAEAVFVPDPRTLSALHAENRCAQELQRRTAFQWMRGTCRPQTIMTGHSIK